MHGCVEGGLQRFNDHKATGENRVVLGVIVHVEDVIAGAGNAHHIAGEVERVVNIRGDGVERVAGLGNFIFHKTIEVFNLVHTVGFPVVGTVDEGVFEVVAVGFDVVEGELQLFIAVKFDDGEAGDVAGLHQLNAIYAFRINHIGEINMVEILCLHESGDKAEDEKETFFHKGGFASCKITINIDKKVKTKLGNS